MNDDPNNNFNNLVTPQPEPQPITPQPAPTQPIISQPEPKTPQPIMSQPEPEAPQPIVSQPEPEVLQSSSTPVIDQTTASVPAQQPSIPKKHKNPLPIIIIAVIVITLIVLGIIFIPKLIGGNGKDGKSLADSIKESDSFFIEDGDGKYYALFDIEGNQLTDFTFTRYTNFINGAAKVENKNEEDGVIGDDGKMIIDFGVCKYLYQEGALYSCTDKDYNDSLIDAKGNTLLEGKDLEIDAAGYSDLVTLVKEEGEGDDDGTFTVYNYNGDVMTSFPVNEKAKREPIADHSTGNYTAVAYDGTVYVFDSAKSKLLLSFEDSSPYYISSVNSANVNEFILSAFEELGKDSKDEHKLIRDGKIVLTQKDMLYYDEDMLVSNGNNGHHILDENGNQVAERFHSSYKDSKNYIVENKKDSSKVSLYTNGEKQKQVSCSYLEYGYAYHGIYTLEYCKGLDKGDNIFMKFDGTIINKKSYKQIYKFDKNGYASVSEDGDHYYLINTEGETVSATYAGRIHPVEDTEDVYYGPSEDGTANVFKVNGDVFATGTDIENYSSGAARSNVCISLKKANKYEVYNATEGKQIITLNSRPYLTGKYFYTRENSKVQYYSCVNGKKFYESK